MVELRDSENITMIVEIRNNVKDYEYYHDSWHAWICRIYQFINTKFKHRFLQYHHQSPF